MNFQGTCWVTLLLLLAGCSKPGAEVSEDVTALRVKLPQLSTPLEYRSDRMYKFKAVELDSNALIAGLSEKNPFTLLGKVFETPDNITVLGYSFDQIGSPVLVTFDNSGQELSSKVLYENAMTDSVQSKINLVKVLADRQILFVDSTIYRILKDEGTGHANDSVAVVRKQYRLSNEGLILSEN